LGFLVFFVGLAGTIGSFMFAAAEGRGRYTVFYGAIVWGFLQIIAGFVMAIRWHNQPQVADEEDDEEEAKEEDDGRPSRRRKAKKETSQVPTPVLIGCGAAGGLLLLGLACCGVAIFIIQTLPDLGGGPGPPPPPPNNGIPVAEDLGPQQAQTAMAGATQDPTFKELAPDGGMLVGLEVGLGHAYGVELVQAIQPRFQTPAGEVMGRKFGTNFTKTVSVKARPGYAIGAIRVKAGLVVNGFSVTFMRIKGNTLDPNDSYPSDWIGDQTGGGGPTVLGGDGALIIGIIGRRSATDCNGLGLLKRI
jgi:hypothetical protein